MAKHGKPRRGANFANYLKGNIGLDIALGTLAPDTGILGPTNVLNERARCTSVKNTYTLSGHTPAENEGPIMMLVAHSDYTLAEIDAWIEQTDSWAAGNKVAKEVSARLIRKIGIFPNPEIVGGAVVLNDGKPIRTKLNWQLNSGQGLNFVAYNLGSVALATTDPNVNVQGHANLWTN